MNDFALIKKEKEAGNNGINLQEYIKENREEIDRISITKGKTSYNFDLSSQLYDIYKYKFDETADKEKIYKKLISRCKTETSEYKKGVEVFTTEIFLGKKLEIEAYREYGFLTLFFLFLIFFLFLKLIKFIKKKNK